MSGEGASWPPDYCRLVFIDGDGLTEADISLSATRFPGVAAAILEILQLYPVIPHQKPELPVPRGGALEVGEKGPGAGAVPAFLTHNLYSCRLALGLNIPGGVGDDVQFHAIIQLFLGSILGLFQRVQGAQPLVAGAILNFHKALAAFNLFTHESLLDLRAFIIGE